MDYSDNVHIRLATSENISLCEDGQQDTDGLRGSGLEFVQRNKKMALNCWTIVLSVYRELVVFTHKRRLFDPSVMGLSATCTHYSLLLLNSRWWVQPMGSWIQTTPLQDTPTHQSQPTQRWKWRMIPSKDTNVEAEYMCRGFQHLLTTTPANLSDYKLNTCDFAQTGNNTDVLMWLSPGLPVA